jgi:ABC-type amino acid transport substrate-binding protein
MKYFFLAVLLPMTLGLSHVPARADDALVVAVNYNDRPFGYFNDHGELTGFMVDMARALCQAMQRECRLQPTVLADFLPGVVDGRYDFAVANLMRSPEREKQVDFTNRLWRSSSCFVGKAGLSVEQTLDTLKGKSIAVQKGSTQEKYLREHIEAFATIKTYPTNIERNAALAAGEADLTFGSTISHFAFLTSDSGKSFEIVSGPMFDQGLGGDVAIPLHKGRDDLRKQLNQAIETILRDGTYARITNTYFKANIF